MTVRDLKCWPPRWRRDSRVSGHVANGESGTLIAVRWDLENQSLALTMEDKGDRHSAVREDEVGELQGETRRAAGECGITRCAEAPQLVA